MWISSRDDQADWVKVLEELYERKATIDKKTLNSMEDVSEHINNPNDIKEKLDLSSQEMSETTDQLYELDLIEDPSFPIALTQEGFRMAHRIKAERQRRKTNSRLLCLTAILAVLTFGLLGIELAPIFIGS
jgi:hypothetical protein